MKAIKVQDNPSVYQIKVPYPNLMIDYTSSYVIEDGGQFLIVDVGAPSDEGAAYLTEALAELGVRPENSSYFLTHLHYDHAGLARRVIPKGSNLYVNEMEYYISRDEIAAKLLDQLQQRFEHEGLSPREAHEYLAARFFPDLFDVNDHTVVFVREGNRIMVGEFDLEVVDASGHTRGQQALFERASGAYFCGDQILHFMSPSIEYFYDAQDSYQTCINNLIKARDLGIKNLYQAHGSLKGDPTDRINWLVEHYEERLKTVARIIADNPGLVGMDIIRKIRWNVPYDTWEDIHLAQRSIILRQGLVYIDHLLHTDKIVRIQEGDGYFRYVSRERP